MNSVDKDFAFGWMSFDPKIGNFIAICDKSRFKDYPNEKMCGRYYLQRSDIDIEGIKKSITTFVELSGQITNLMLVQTRNQSGQYFSRKLMHIFAELFNNDREILFRDVSDSYNDTKSEFNHIKQLDPSLQVMGLFAKTNSNGKYNVYVLIQNKDSITYCLLNDVIYALLSFCLNPLTCSELFSYSV